jgi:type IV pilus assembly protein PilF
MIVARLLVLLALACPLLAYAASEPEGRPPQASQAAKLNAELGIAYLERGDVALAQQKIERALGQNASDPDVQTAAGILYERIGMFDKADAHYQAAMRGEGKDPNRQNNYAGFLCRRGTYEKGHKLLEETARNQRYATPWVAMTNAGVCARSNRNLEQAERDFKAALASNPTYPDALLQLADLSFSRGDFISARGYLSRLVGSSSTNADALLLGARIESAAGDPRAAREFADKLRRDFPDAPQVRQLDEVLAP